MQKLKFCIYNDVGVGQNGICELIKLSKKFKADYSIIDSNDIINGILKPSNNNVLFIGGGADLYYCEKLNGVGCNNIKQFVNDGGIYIGICAGAYFAHQSINWQNTTETIQGARELSFFNGCATGPLKKPYVPEQNNGLIYVDVYETNDEKQQVICYYNGGPVMYADNKTNVIAWFLYKNKKHPAIMYKNIGQGKAIAMSPHMEFSDEYLNSIDAPDCKNRQHMFVALINKTI